MGIDSADGGLWFIGRESPALCSVNGHFWGSKHPASASNGNHCCHLFSADCMPGQSWDWYFLRQESSFVGIITWIQKKLATCLKKIFWLSALGESSSFCFGASQKLKKSVASSIWRKQIPCFHNLLTSHFTKLFVRPLQFPTITTGSPMSYIKKPHITMLNRNSK